MSGKIGFWWAEIGILFLYARIAKVIAQFVVYVSLQEPSVMST